MSDCTDNCVNQGIKTLSQIILSIIQGALPPDAAQKVTQLLTDALNTTRCKLPPDIIKVIKTQISLLQEISVNTLSRINTAYLVMFTITFIILVIFNYVALLLMEQFYIILFFILSILVIIINMIILYFWIRSIYNNASEQGLVISTETIKILNEIIAAGQEGLCCLGQCSACTTC